MELILKYGKMSSPRVLLQRVLQALGDHRLSYARACTLCSSSFVGEAADAFKGAAYTANRLV